MHLTTETLTDYLHHELAPAEDARVLAHLEHCTECSELLESESKLTEMLRSAAKAEELELPLGFSAAIMRAVQEHKASPIERLRAFLNPVITVPVAAALAAAAFVLMPAMQHGAGPAGPALPVQYYLEEHAASASQNPLSDRSAATMMVESADRQVPGAGVSPAFVEAANTTTAGDERP